MSRYALVERHAACFRQSGRMSEPAPTQEDYAFIDVAARELRHRGWRIDFSPNAVVSGWASFVQADEEGDEMTIDDYTNDLSVRRAAEESRQYLTPVILDALDDRLKPLDDLFRAATFEAGKLSGSGQTHWWESRLPRVLVGELAEDVDRMGLRPDST
jgi:hypothetical protein